MADVLDSNLLLSLERLREKYGDVDDDLIHELRQMHYRLAFGVESWYNVLYRSEESASSSDADNGLCSTMKTTFVQLDSREIDWLLTPASVASFLNDDGDDDDDSDVGVDLARRLDAAIDSVGSRAFIKLNSRAPKDTSTNATVESVAQSVVRSLGGARPSGQQLLDEFMRCSARLLCVDAAHEGGKHAIQLLASSARTVGDLQRFKTLRAHMPTTSICVREWRDNICADAHREFRVFVVNNRLTAASAYDYVAYHRELVDEREQIRERIARFFADTLRDRLPHRTYIVDLFVPRNADELLVVIELNSFESWTSACLFSWTNDRDILLGKSDNDWPIRVVAKPDNEQQHHSECLSLIPFAYRDVFEQVWPEEDKEEDKGEGEEEESWCNLL
jgi:D123